MKFKSFLINLTRCLVIIALITFCLSANAASSYNARDMYKISYSLNRYYSGVSALVKAISLVFIYIGSFKVYWKMQHGDRDVSKTIIMIVGGCVALTTMIALFPLIFTSRY